MHTNEWVNYSYGMDMTAPDFKYALIFHGASGEMVCRAHVKIKQPEAQETELFPNQPIYLIVNKS